VRRRAMYRAHRLPGFGGRNAEYEHARPVVTHPASTQIQWPFMAVTTVAHMAMKMTIAKMKSAGLGATVVEEEEEAEKVSMWSKALGLERRRRVTQAAAYRR
jgi:ABC-type lipopolysaccharide export system ATPase subunit